MRCGLEDLVSACENVSVVLVHRAKMSLYYLYIVWKCLCSTCTCVNEKTFFAALISKVLLSLDSIAFRDVNHWSGKLVSACRIPSSVQVPLWRFPDSQSGEDFNSVSADFVLARLCLSQLWESRSMLSAEKQEFEWGFERRQSFLFLSFMLSCVFLCRGVDMRVTSR